MRRTVGGEDQGGAKPLAVEVRDLACRFDDPAVQALAGVSLAIARGELVAIMGESGAGKSTLLRCVNALVPSLAPAACTGTVRLHGMDILGHAVGDLAGRVAMVFQDFEAQLFSTNVRLEVAFGPSQLGVPGEEIARRVAAALELVDLTAFVDRDPTRLSGGQKQRLAIASILAMAPDVVLLDEPGTDLDPVGRAELYAALARLRGEGLTLVAVEHEIDPLLAADRLVLMRRGEIVASGVPAELARDPDLFVHCGVRPHDLAVLGRRLGVELPLDVEGAIAVLRAHGLPRAGESARRDATVASAVDTGRHAGAEEATTVPSRAGTPILAVEGLGHAYEDGPPVLADVSLRIDAGEIIALIGQNGSGKTTLAKHLNGLLQPTRGSVRLDGVELREVPLERAAQEVGYVFQNPDHQLFAGTVEEEVAFGPRNVGLTGAALAARVTDVLVAVGLEALRDRDPFLLSKGDRERLAVAAVLAMAPRVLVLDEPTTGLDYPQQRRMLELLVRLRASRGTTIVIITHSPWVVAEYAERALLMRAGRLVFDGPLATLVGAPELLRASAFELPPATRVAHALGVRARSADELATVLGAPPAMRRPPARRLPARRLPHPDPRPRTDVALSLYVDPPSALHRRHPVAKVLAMVMLFAATFLMDDPVLVVPVTVLVLLATAASGALGNLWRLRWLVGPVFLFTVTIWTVFYPVSLGSSGGRAEAFRFGLGMAFKLETFLATGVLFLGTTTVEEFAFALTRLGLPYRAGFALTLAFRLVPVFLEAAFVVVDAQRCRGLDFARGGVRERIARYVPIIVPVFVGGLRRADQMAFALEVRGFSSGRARTALPRPRPTAADYLLVAAAAALLVAYVMLWLHGAGRIVPR